MSTAVLPRLVGPFAEDLQAALNADIEYQSCRPQDGICVAIKSTDAEDSLVIDVNGNQTAVFLTSSPKATFTLSAKPDHWEKFFAAVPEPIFQSYWGILRTFGHEEGVGITGDIQGFSRHARLWRMALDRLRVIINVRGAHEAPDVLAEDEQDEDSIVGRYTWIRTPRWGSCKIFYETAGHGPQHILFLHTAGSDSRQFHALMNDKGLQQRCTMVAFDLPAHGRSYLGLRQIPQDYTNDEENYLAAIGEVIKKTKLVRPVVTGASMAGQICLAVAIHAQELGVRGVIPCQACDHIPLVQPAYEVAGDSNEAVLNPERVSGMIGPLAPRENRRLIWWIYSSQGAQVFQGDLKFYFRGWDGRGRVDKIDTQTCPVYMLTGAYDYSCPPALSEATAQKIQGAKYETMEGLGHFPMTEDPAKFLPYLLRALDYIDSMHQV